MDRESATKLILVFLTVSLQVDLLCPVGGGALLTSKSFSLLVCAFCAWGNYREDICIKQPNEEAEMLSQCSVAAVP